MTRYRITIEYDGTGLAGWQRQKDHPSVQQHIEEAIFKFCGEEVRIQGAGRTDAGVHAYAQVASFDLERDDSPKTVMNAINFHLGPARIAIYECETVDTDFNARFSALSRSYIYRIVNRHARLALDNGYAWHVKRELDDVAMQEAANVLVGKHDFSSFRAAACQAKSPIKTLSKLDVIRTGDMIECQVAAPSFLHNQVRAMVGTLSLVGSGQWSPTDVRVALEAKDRQKAGPNAPAHGLYFETAVYDS